MLRKMIHVCVLPFLLVGFLVGSPESAQAVQTIGNVVCVNIKSNSGGYVTAYSFNYSRTVPRGYCTTDLVLSNVQAFRVPSNWVAVSQWGWNYYPGVHYFSSNFQKLTLTLIYKPGILPAV